MTMMKQTNQKSWLTVFATMAMVLVMQHSMGTSNPTLVQAVMSDKCRDETGVIQELPELKLELAVVLRNMSGEAQSNNDTDECSTEAWNKFNCNFTFDGDSANYSDVCEAANGTFYYDHVQIDCHILFQFNMLYQNVPFCVSASCDVNAIDHDDILSLNNTEMTEFQNEFRGIGCVVDGSGARAAYSYSSVLVGVVVGALATSSRLVAKP